jgi:hypothetical protein
MFPDDGVFTDNAIASYNWFDYYQAISKASHARR